jgi:hypothetical protein
MLAFISQHDLNRRTYEERMRFLYTHVPLGHDPTTQQLVMLPDRDRLAGMYVIGKQETGKSSLLENLATFDAAVEHAVFFLDPHGDTVMNIIASLPPQCLPRVSLLDMEDEEYPFGLNLFDTGELTTQRALSQAVARIEHLFHVLWPEVLKQQHFRLYLRMAILALLSSPGKTLVDMDPFLSDDDVRADILSQVKDPKVQAWWYTHYDLLDKNERAGRVRPLTNRLGSLFAGRSLVSNIVGQNRTTIDFRRAIERKELIFVKLPVNTLEDDARLVGTFLLAKLQAAIFSFVDVDPAQRPVVGVYADEFQNFATPDFDRLFTQGRKFGAMVTVAHQYRNQLTTDLQEATLTARTIICFRVTPANANEMAKVFPAQPGTLELSTRATKELLSLSHSAHLPPVVRDFIETYLRALPKGGSDVVIKREPSLLDRLNGTKPSKTTAANPIASLDGLFYQVMQSGNPHVPIPWNAVQGLANGGRGFYAATLKRRNRYLLTCGIERLPAHFIAVTQAGPRWTWRPEDAKEQLEHCIFHLRMTMAYLAEHPVGKQSAPSSTGVTLRLTQLRNRAAFVSNAEAAGEVYTQDTSHHVTGAELTERLRQLRAQTRAHCCHPRAEIEHPPEQAPAQSRTSGSRLSVAAHRPRFTRSEEVP